MANILDGRALGRRLNKATRGMAQDLARVPGLAVVLVGQDPASQIYVRTKGRVAERLGFHHQQIDLPQATAQGDLEAIVDRLASDDAVDGILVQLPLPSGLDADPVMDRIPPDKDVDGFTTRSAGLLAQGRPKLVPCTARGVMALIEEAGVDPKGLQACVIGRSNIVGRPTAMLLEQANATVTVCHSRTRDLAAVVRRSDIVVAAVGVAELVRGDWVKEGAVVVDVGMNRRDDGSLVGDVDFDGASERAAAITPVPGGVGPLTIAMLMRNTLNASKERQAR